MPYNRLRLDWKLETKEERKAFVDLYLQSIPFANSLTPHELETLSDYILWGKNSEGLNGHQEGIQFETARKTWVPNREESLEALLESPAFSETLLRRPTDPVYKTPRLQFSRSAARKDAPPHILDIFETLWDSIDRIELLINFYDLSHGRRQTPPRDSLLRAFTTEEIDELRERASKLSLQRYLYLKHELVELRREQYTLKDFYAAPHLSHPTFNAFSIEEFNLAAAPLPLNLDEEMAAKFFPDGRYPEPQDFEEEELKKVSSILWENSSTSSSMQSVEGGQPIDYTDPTHLYALSEFFNSIEDIDSSPILQKLYARFNYYAGLAKLKPFHLTLLRLKLQNKPNKEISDILYEETKHRYTLNYISTLYCKTILPAIAHAASLHRQTLESIFFPEEFKTCIDCGRTLLRQVDFFMRKTKVKDGYAPRCKTCDKKKRDTKRRTQ